MTEFLETLAGREVEEHPVEINGRIDPNYKAITNAGNRATFKVVSKGYVPLFNNEFEDFAQSSVKTVNEFYGNDLFSFKHFIVAKEGRRVMAVLQNNEEVNLMGHNVKQNIVLLNSHDTFYSVRVGATHLMNRCSNMFSSADTTVSYHSNGLKDNLENLKSLLAEKGIDSITGLKVMKDFATIKVEDRWLSNFALACLGIDSQKMIAGEVTSNMMQKLSIFNRSLDIECKGLGQTLYGALQGVYHYTSNKHPKATTNDHNFFSSANNLNKKAFGLVYKCYTQAQEQNQKVLLK